MNKRSKSKAKSPRASSPKKSMAKSPRASSPRATTPKPEKIQLKAEQVPQVKKLIEILKNNICAFDMSMMGAGKTYVSSEVAIKFGFKRVIVICPASVVGKWREMKTKYGLNLEEVLSYESLRSTQDHQPSHGLLTRFDETVYEDTSKSPFNSGLPSIMSRHKVRFEATEKLKTIVKEGCLFIFDEAQKVKNKNAQWHASKAIAETLIGIAGKSRFLMLSGTPIDKEEHALNIMMMMGFIRSAKLYTTDDGKITLLGAKELILFCTKVNKEATEETLAEFPIRQKEDVAKLCYKLFQNVIKKFMTTSMKKEKISGVDIDIKNGYYKLDDPVASARLRTAIDSISRTLRKRIYRRTDTTYNTAFLKLAAVTSQLHQIENIKVPIFRRLAMEKLESNPNAKVAIFLNYNSSVDALMTDLAKYNPIKFTGSVPKEERQKLLNKFQEGNTTYRLFIGNIEASATGIDLDDKFGNFPRYAYASPNFHILNLHQLTYRFLRSDTKSSSVFRFVYVKGYAELNIINNLARKSEVMKETLDVQREQGVRFPGEYENEIEE